MTPGLAALLDAIALACTGAGASLMVLGAVAFFILADPYLRGHAVTAVLVGAAPLVLAGLSLDALTHVVEPAAASDSPTVILRWALAGRIFALGLVVMLAAPVFAHVVAAAAYAAGIPPSLDPGAQRRGAQTAP